MEGWEEPVLPAGPCSTSLPLPEWLGGTLGFGNVNLGCESWPFHAGLAYIKFVCGETPQKGTDAVKSVTPAQDQLMIYSGQSYSLTSEMPSPINTRR